MKRIVTLQDVSCVGKCALTVALPVISAMGVETAVITDRGTARDLRYGSGDCGDPHGVVIYSLGISRF